MTISEIFEALDKIGCPSVTTLDGDAMHSRIIHMTGADENGIYFLTMDSKPFYRQLKANGEVSVCGIYPASHATGRNKDGQPAFVPGYTLRIMGEALEMKQEEIEAGVAAGSDLFKYFLEEQARYPAERLFRIHKGKGEIFDFDFETVNRDHKVLRTRFSFGGETHNDSGCRITGECIACGACEEACTFKAIVSGEPYSIDGSRCDECGSCVQVCPQEAIELPLTI